MIDFLKPQDREALKEVKKFNAIHWAFLFLIVLPFAVIATPFALCGMIAQAILALIGWLALRLPDYKPKKL
jgi:hypothetical protein